MVSISRVMIEGKRDPIDVSTRTPKFSWSLECDDRRNVVQAGYAIQVAKSQSFLDLVWDSGRVDSDVTTHISYGGERLHSTVPYYVRISVWDEEGQQSAWSRIAHFEIAPPADEPWQAQWITADSSLPAIPVHYFLKSISVNKRVAHARMYVTSLGLYQVRLDGRRISEDVLSPGWTSYHHQVQYQTYDVTDQMSIGDHEVCVAVADGWYKGNLGWKGQRELYGDKRALFLQLALQFEDGTEQVVATDDSWMANTGPIQFAEMYHGETYDARIAFPSMASGLDACRQVTVLDKSTDILIPQINEPVRITHQLKPVEWIHTPAGDTVLDFGQNMVGWVRFQITAPRGTVVELEHAEILDKDGNFYTENLRSAKQKVTYVCSGAHAETYEPSFTFQGFRYVKLSGFDTNIDLNQFTGCVIHTDFEETGTFECSNPMVNQLQKNIVWGQRGNFVDVPTDCPQRDERLGWTGDAQVFLKTAAFNYNVQLFFKKWLKDLTFNQFEDGGVPAVIPNILSEGHCSSAWGDAAVICPWDVFLCYGDVDVLDSQYDSMKAWVEYIRQQGDDEYLWNTGWHYGDWLALDAEDGSYIGATPRDLIATAFYAHSTDLLARAAEELGKLEDMEHYRTLHRRIVEKYRDTFFTSDGELVANTQTAHTVTLMFDLAETEWRHSLADHLRGLIEQNGNRLDTGFVGTPYLCHVLTEHGHHDLACILVNQTEYPSWIYSILQGATTIWEHWDGVKPNGEFWSKDMNSFNHYAYGSIGDWLYRKLAGLDWGSGEPGGRMVSVKPHPDKTFTFASASYETLVGTYRSGWHADWSNHTMRVEVQVPANGRAKISLPGAQYDLIRESGTPLQQCISRDRVTVQDDRVEFCVGSGLYIFEYTFS